MDISSINDIKELKALAYDILRQREQLQIDLDQVNLRIRQVEQEAQSVQPKKSAHA